MTELLRPELLALVVGVVGACEAVKHWGIKIPTVFASLLVSVGAGIAYASPLTWQTAIVSTLILYGAATLSYEAIVKRMTHHGDKQRP